MGELVYVFNEAPPRDVPRLRLRDWAAPVVDAAGAAAAGEQAP